MLKVDRLTKLSFGGWCADGAEGRDVRDFPPARRWRSSARAASGKTTLLGLCAGLDQPTSGNVAVAGELIGAMDEDARALVGTRTSVLFSRISS